MSLFRKKEDTARDFYEQCFVDFQRRTHESIKYLAKENEELKKELKGYQQMYFDKVMIINKAIEYIEHSNWLRQDQIYNSCDMQGWEVKELLEILKGEN